MRRTVRVLAAAAWVCLGAATEMHYDSMPAPGAENTDLRYLLSLGWSF